MPGTQLGTLLLGQRSFENNEVCGPASATQQWFAWSCQALSCPARTCDTAPAISCCWTLLPEAAPMPLSWWRHASAPAGLCRASSMIRLVHVRQAWIWGGAAFMVGMIVVLHLAIICCLAFLSCAACSTLEAHHPQTATSRLTQLTIRTTCPARLGYGTDGPHP